MEKVNYITQLNAVLEMFNNDDRCFVLGIFPFMEQKVFQRDAYHKSRADNGKGKN